MFNFSLTKIVIFFPLVVAELFLAASTQAQLVAPPAFPGTAQGGLVGAIYTIITIFLILAGLAAAIYLILGGIRYITSRGDEKAAESAKNTITFAVIGLIVIGLATAIVRFVIGAINLA